MGIYKQIAFYVACILFIFLLAGCSAQGDTLNNKDTDLPNNGYTMNESAPPSPNPSAGSSGQIHDLGNQHLDAWVGEYSFYESTPHVNPDAPDMFWNYSISLFKENNGYFANIYVDGFQTMKRIKAKVLGNSEKIDLIFEEYLPEDSHYMDIIAKGDKLLSFKKNNSEILTEWGVLKPMLLENETPNKAYFKKAR